MLRVHITNEDLSRVRFASGPDPLWETVMSIRLLRGTWGGAVFDPWRAQVRDRLCQLPQRYVRLLRHLVSPAGDLPGFLTPQRAGQGLEAGIEAVLGTPRVRLRRELAALPGAPSWLRPLAEGEPAALARLGAALRAYHHVAIAPFWPRVRSLVDAERAARARIVLDHGTEGLLAAMRPAMLWQAPVLEVGHPVEREIRLAGRGLVLVPSAFCWRWPVTVVHPGLPPVLMYPVERGPEWWAGPDHAPGARALANLLGPTRAACLTAIGNSCTTGELARRTGVTAPTASLHATTLRAAGLTTSTRRGNTVVHTPTPLGSALLRASGS